jgi:pilus assembly protein Flp/PilA
LAYLLPISLQLALQGCVFKAVCKGPDLASNRQNEIVMITRFSTEEEGQTLVDYALVIGLIALVVIVSLTVLRKPVETVFNSATNAFSTATSGAPVTNGASGVADALPKGSGITVALTVLWAVVAFFFGFYVFLKLTGEADTAGEPRESFDHKDDLKP